MSVLVDTTIWSEALRRRATRPASTTRELSALIDEDRVVVIGAIRQELLSGLRTADQFQVLRDRLRAFPDVKLDSSDYENAASCFNECRARGVQGANTDFLLCAAAMRRDWSIFTADADFGHYRKVIGIKLHAVRRTFA